MCFNFLILDLNETQHVPNNLSIQLMTLWKCLKVLAGTVPSRKETSVPDYLELQTL